MSWARSGKKTFDAMEKKTGGDRCDRLQGLQDTVLGIAGKIDVPINKIGDIVGVGVAAVPHSATGFGQRVHRGRQASAERR